MAPKKAAQIKSSSSTPTTKTSDLIWDCNILSFVNIRHITEAEERRWKVEGLELGLLEEDFLFAYKAVKTHP